MELQDAIEGRRSIRKFTDKQIDPDILVEVLNAARFAPSAGGIHPWKFVLVKDNKLKQDLAGREKDAIPTILSGYSSIQSIEASLWPFWRGSFPEDVDKISIEQILK